MQLIRLITLSMKKKNVKLLRNDILSLINQINKRFDKLEINNLNNQELNLVKVYI